VRSRYSNAPSGIASAEDWARTIELEREAAPENAPAGAAADPPAIVAATEDIEDDRPEWAK
jgi:hypothetical protein